MNISDRQPKCSPESLIKLAMNMEICFCHPACQISHQGKISVAIREKTERFCERREK
ncbi:Uncharacterized protein dnm_021880 [Desulfonema magnum]|uniref:Uncharacterized protein n=1 Tax=Desulfonema magnum TaxID=45655 RepID=A0A975BII9_9BACT|nr:Uncharacterized protein dnm_021880 [Desulfonema magnum]